MSLSEFCMTLVQLLSSSRSSDDLQAELFDLIGFEKIELIQLILTHRQEIVESKNKNKNVMKREIAIAAASKFFNCISRYHKGKGGHPRGRRGCPLMTSRFKGKYEHGKREMGIETRSSISKYA